MFRRVRRALLTAAITAAVVVAAQLASAQPAAAATWTTQPSGTTVNLNGVSCPNTYTCWAVGDAGRVVRTVDGGVTWTTQRSGGVYNVTDISCPTVTTCFFVETWGVYATTDAGSTWTQQLSPATPVYAVSCPTALTCVASGNDGNFWRTTNGTTWTAVGSMTPHDLFSVECPTTLNCYTSGYGGTVLASTDFGSTWSARTTATSKQVNGVGCASATTCYAAVWDDDLEVSTGGAFTEVTGAYGMWDVSCPTASTCFGAGPDGRLTTNGSGSWTLETSPTTSHLRRISCPAAATCWAVGANGTIVVTGAGTPPPPPPPPAVPPCGNGVTVVDGYLLGTYARLAYEQQSDGAVVVCYQVNADQVTDSGMLTIRGATADPGTPVVNDSVSPCSPGPNELAGPHPYFEGGSGSTRVLLDAFTSGNVAGICLQAAGVARRVSVTVPAATLPSVTPVRDTPARTAPPHRQGVAGLKSSLCPTSGDLVNARLSGTDVRAATAHPSTYRFEVCVRATSGTQAAGGRLVVSAEGVPGVAPYVTPGADLSQCTFPVFDTTSPVVLDVRTSAPTASGPVSVCVKTPAGTQTYTVGVSGSLQTPTVQFEQDAF